MIRALVTGGSGSIGSAISRRLAADGCHVIVHAANHVGRAEALATELIDAGGSAESCQFDVTDATATRAAIEFLIADEPIQVLVSNAGIHDDAPLGGMTAEQWHTVIDVSLNGFFNVCRPLLMPMAKTRWGRIIAVSSVAGQLGNRGQANYAAAKAGLHGAVKSVSIEMASRGITANVVAPGIIASDMTDGVFDQNAVDAMVPAKRIGEPAEVAALIAFLASAESSYVTGQVIGVNGGMA
jgi:3-oxoacyl-[acyl-carrier protein] reductase